MKHKMARNPFTSKFMRDNFDDAVKQYELRHRNFFNLHGQPMRGNGLASPFWKGFFGDPMSLIPKNTPAHAYYRAGQALGNPGERGRWSYDGQRSLVPGLSAVQASQSKEIDHKDVEAPSANNVTEVADAAAKPRRGRPPTGRTPDPVRQSRSHAALKKAGGRKLSVNLSPAGADHLAKLMAAMKLTQKDAVHMALERAAEGLQTA